VRRCMASYNGVQAAVLSRPGCRLILARSLVTSKNTAWLVFIQAVTLRPCAWHVSIGASQGAPLWYSRVPAGDVTCELYCILLWSVCVHLYIYVLVCGNNNVITSISHVRII